MNPISLQEAVEYLTLHAQQSKTEKRLEELKKIILPKLVAGETSPKSLPFLLTNRPQKRPKSDWKGACFEALRKLFKSPARAQKRMDELDKSWTVDENPSLVVVKNPDYEVQLNP